MPSVLKFTGQTRFCNLNPIRYVDLFNKCIFSIQ